MKAIELSGPLVKALAQAELTEKHSVIKAKEKEIRSSDIKLLESLVKELDVTRTEKSASLSMTPARKEKILQQANPTKIPRKLTKTC